MKEEEEEDDGKNVDETEEEDDDKDNGFDKDGKEVGKCDDEDEKEGDDDKEDEENDDDDDDEAIEIDPSLSKSKGSTACSFALSDTEASRCDTAGLGVETVERGMRGAALTFVRVWIGAKGRKRSKRR